MFHRGVQDERGVVRFVVVRGLHDRELAQLGVCLLGDHDLDLLAHEGHPGCALGVGDDQPGAGMPGAKLQVARAQLLGAGHRDEAGLQRPEHDPVPGRRSADEDEQPFSGSEPTRSKQRSPAVCLHRDLPERQPVDDPVAVDERQGSTMWVGGECLDDVARVVEPLRDLPDTVARRRRGNPLTAEESSRHLFRWPSLAARTTSSTVARRARFRCSRDGSRSRPSASTLRLRGRQ